LPPFPFLNTIILSLFLINHAFNPLKISNFHKKLCNRILENLGYLCKLRCESTVATVTDDGVGMDERTAATLLEPGSGRGMSGGLHNIGVRKVYERLKLLFGESAEIFVRSRPGEGTSVTVRWPIQVGKEETDERLAR